MIEAAGLSRRFTTKHGVVDAVRSVDFTVDAGEIVGFLGPNGAGKTTTMRMLTTLLKPTSGSAVVAGCDLATDPVGVRRRIGYVSQGGGANPGYIVHEEIELQARLYGLGRAEVARRVDEVIAILDLAELRDRVVGTLSGGQRRRLDIALGLVHGPELVFLDEPSAGLDPTSRSHLWSYIRRLRDEHGTTVFLSTHYLDEADALCDRVLIMDAGRIIAEDSPETLKQRVSDDVVIVEISGDVEVAGRALREEAAVRDLTVDGAVLRFGTDRGDKAVTTTVRALDRADIEVLSIRVERPTLDDVFLALTEETPIAA
ncbi:ATP-binding cassette domain-containing protein [Longispora fulva]|uniref:ATP-binding cassette domain-containing protein n=1 Tax=Longispora fulva TaxID=619741 RepID=UPI0018CBAE5A